MDDRDGKNGYCDMENSVEMDDSNPEGDEDGISETTNSSRREPTDEGLFGDELEEGEFFMMVNRDSDHSVDCSTDVATSEVNKVNNLGSNSHLVKSGCFGPFKSGPVNNGGRKLPKSFGPLLGNMDDLDLDVEFLADGSNRKKTRRSSPPRLDLNCNPSSSFASDHVPDGDDDGSASNHTTHP
ncbi:unnamed protein product [Lactuca virosa]|uniref:Uncharacterized protein n=1 Tax=Lactuca virosa TaxID=75947 RepID=A0AAU9MGK0_9ASTR|nr:unnamed protein product [Lactuca virosa]